MPWERNCTRGWLTAVSAVAAGIVAGAVAAEDLGTVTGTVDGVARDWRVPEGLFVTPDRAAATWERADGDSLQIIVEAGDPTRTGHPGAGLVAAMLQAGPDGEGMAAPHLVLVGDWPADARSPGYLYHPEGAVTVRDARLQPPERDGARLHVEVALAAELCAQDVDGRPIDPPGAPRCVDVDLHLATAALPHDMIPQAPAPDMRETPPPPPAAAAPAPATGGATLEVLGSVTGTVGGTDREWLTLQGEIRGEDGATAFWRRTEIAIPSFGDTLGGMIDALPEAERAEIEAQVQALDQLTRGDGTVADVLGQISGTRGGGHSFTDLTIGGHDPDSPNILTDGTLTLELTLPDGPVAAGTTLPATVTYVVEGGSLIPQLFYVSGEDGREGSVTFDRLEIAPGGGHAIGRFEATLCRMEAARLMAGPDLSDCIPAVGVFDTALGEDTGR